MSASTCETATASSTIAFDASPVELDPVAASSPPLAEASAGEPAQPAGRGASLLRTYVVSDGESIRSIAQQYGVKVETIVWANELTDPDALQPGQQLRVPTFDGVLHEVQSGDTVGSIAGHYGARAEDVVQANGLEAPDLIAVGHKLAVPGGRPPLPPREEPAVVAQAAAPPAPTPTPRARKPLPVLGDSKEQRFIASVGEAAIASKEATGVPASVTLAQAILESYWGTSRLAREAKNYFGIKAQTRPGPAGVLWLDVWEVVNGHDVTQPEPFRMYHTVEQSFLDHGRFFIENRRYREAMAARDDARRFAREIARAGYATDPGYAPKLIELMDRFGLDRFDE